MRVLHVLGAMNRGGVETWLIHLLRHRDQLLAMDFLVHTDRPGAYDDEVRALGGRIHVCPDPGRPWAYGRAFRRTLCEHGPYDVVHSHVHHFSGYVLRLAERCGVPMRIAHSHNDTYALDARAGLLRRGYLRLMRRWLARHATRRLSASREAAAALFGPGWQADPRHSVLYCGIDLAPFRSRHDRAALRSELGIPPDALVIGHVGRFAPQKNHAFLVDIAAEAARRRSLTCLLLVGDGALRLAIERRVRALGLTNRVIFAGWRSDVSRLLAGAVDVFVMPSTHEGLPLAGLEAQAAGVPLVLSDGVTAELEVVPALVHRCSLAQPASLWAETVLAQGQAPPVGREEALALMEASPFNIKKAATSLEQLYAADRPSQ
jgi:glycosyltransferase involved in cell wall biosynthesis